jgi:hypothetical protein
MREEDGPHASTVLLHRRFDRTHPARRDRGWVEAGLTVAQADALGRKTAVAVSAQVPDMTSFTWTTRAAPT